MQETIRAIVSKGRLEPLDELSIPDGTEVVVTIVSNGEFWLDASESSLETIWGSPEDDVYAELLSR